MNDLRTNTPGDLYIKFNINYPDVSIYSLDEINKLRKILSKGFNSELIMEEKISQKLADPKIYLDTNRDRLVVLNTKYAEVRKAMTKAEDLWETAQKKLDNALKSKLNG